MIQYLIYKEQEQIHITQLIFDQASYKKFFYLNHLENDSFSFDDYVKKRNKRASI